MIDQIIKRIMEEFPRAKGEPFKEHPLAGYIREEAPLVFGEQSIGFEDIIWDASPGKGNWVEAPWIAAFDPLVTESAQQGYYPVYLFTKSLDAVYLSFNQGMELLKREFGVKGARDILRHRSNVLKKRLAPEFKERFNDHQIDLQSSKAGTNLELYECGHAFGIRYDQSKLPSSTKLVEDLLNMLNLYRLATLRGGTGDVDSPLEEADPLAPNLGAMTIEEIKQYRFHRTIERNSKIAKAVKAIHKFKCQACAFDFEHKYGELGREYIEAHHLVPLAKLVAGQPLQKSPKDDFRVLCANCHRMIHRSGASTSFDEFCLLVRRSNV